MPAFLHAADLHVESPMKSLSQLDTALGERLRDASRAALANLVTLAIDEQIAFVVLAGDLLDGTLGPGSAAFWPEGVHELSADALAFSRRGSATTRARRARTTIRPITRTAPSPARAARRAPSSPALRRRR